MLRIRCKAMNYNLMNRLFSILNCDQKNELKRPPFGSLFLLIDKQLSFVNQLCDGKHVLAN